MRPEPDREATYEDLVGLPEHLTGQIIAGELITSPRPASDHAVASSALGGELLGPFQRGRGGPGGWWILDEPELHLRKDVLVRIWRVAETLACQRSLVRRPPCSLQTGSVRCSLPRPPGSDRVRKKHIYAREGCGVHLARGPGGLHAEVFQLQEGRWLELGSWSENDRVRAAPFDAIELELEALWLLEAPPSGP